MSNSKFILVGGVLFLFAIITLVPFTSASSFGDFINAANISITITQNDATANLYLNTAGTSFDQQKLTSNDINMTDLISQVGLDWCQNFNCSDFSISFKISDFLNAINGTAEITNSSNIIKLTDLSVSSDNIPFTGTSESGTTINGVLDLTQILPNMQTINSDLAANPLDITSDRDVTFTKSGNTYTIFSDEGYGSIGQDKTHISNLISQDIGNITLDDLINKIIPTTTSKTLNDFLNGANLNYSVTAVDLSNVNLEDGNYVVPITVSDNSGNSFTKNIYLTLEGIKNTDTSNSAKGVYTPSSTEVLNYIDNIVGFNDGVVTVSLFDDGSSYPSISGNVIKYLDFTVTPGINGNSATINFKIPNYKNIDPTRIVLYHFDGTNWNQLPTHYNGVDGSGNYLFYAATTSFSPFAIVETVAPIATAPAIGNNGGVYGGIFVTAPPIATTPAATTPTANTPTPTATGFNFFRALGAVVGAPNSTGTGIVVFIVVILIVGGVITVFVMNRKSSKGKSKKKAEKDEEDEE